MSEAKQVIVIRKDLNMRKGKMCVQAAHASIAFLTEKMQNRPWKDESCTWHQPHVEFTEAEKAWIDGRFTKICVSVNTEDGLMAIHNQARDAGLASYLITDAGLTEFGGIPTRTCLAIGPDWAERIDPITSHLPLL